MTEQKQNYAKIAVKGTIWYYLVYYGSKLLVFLSTLVLARILSQSDFGVASYAITILGFLDVFKGFGLDFALIYVDNESDRSNTAFWLNLFISILLFGIVFIIGTQAQHIFDDQRAIAVTQVLGLTYPLNALCMVQGALLKRDFSYGMKAVPEILYNLGKGVISILLALAGFSYWSLIFGQLGGTVLSVTAYWIVSKWRPRFHYSRTEAKELLHFSKNIAYVKLLSALNQNFTNLFIGRYYGAADLGAYTTSKRIPQVLLTDFCSVTSRITYPIYARVRKSIYDLRKGFFKTTGFTVLLTVPLGIGLCVVAKPFVLVTLTEKWISAIPLVRILALTSMLTTFSYNAGDLFQAVGKPDVMVKVNLFSTIAMIICCFAIFLMGGSIVWICLAMLLIKAITTAVILLLVRSDISASLSEMFKLFRPALVSGLVMGAAAWLVMHFTAGFPPLWNLILSIVAGGLVYVLMLFFFFRDVYKEIIHVVKKSRRKDN